VFTVPLVFGARVTDIGMRIIVAIACLGVLTWGEGANAQHVGARKEYLLMVSVHSDVPKLTRQEVEDILEGASDLLKGNDNNCNVTFKLKGPIQTFGSPSTPAVITSPEERDAVHAVKADVKVVEEIKYCRPDLHAKSFNGCAYPPKQGSRSIIVTHLRASTDMLRSILWAHEFGHRTGLHHRAEPDVLMSGCGGLWPDMTDISRDECRCFLLGPGGCPNAPPDKICSARRRRPGSSTHQ
jgi:hypothetical protein